MTWEIENLIKQINYPIDTPTRRDILELWGEENESQARRLQWVTVAPRLLERQSVGSVVLATR